MYHTTFDPPSDPEVVRRLVSDPMSSESVMIERLMDYHRLVLLSSGATLILLRIWYVWLKAKLNPF